MSDYRFGSGDYGLSIYPTEAFDGIGGFDIDMVERVEIEGVDFVRERTCRETTIDKFFNGCDSCGYMWQFFYSIGKRERPNYCPNCGRKVES